MKKILGIMFVIILIIFVYYFIFNSTPGGHPKSNNDSIKSALVSIKAQSKILFSENNPNSFIDICNNEIIVGLLNDIKKYGGLNKCFSDNSKFVVTSSLKTQENQNTHFCVDSTGISQLITSQQNDLITSANTLCLQNNEKTPENNFCKVDNDCQYSVHVDECNTPEYVNKICEDKKSYLCVLIFESQKDIKCTCENNKCVASRCPVDGNVFFDTQCSCPSPFNEKIGDKDKGFRCVGGV